MGNEKVYQMDFSKVYRLLVDKAERKGRTREEVDEIIRWLTGYGQTELDGLLDHVGYEGVTLDGGSVTLEEGMAIDLGAIAKGYASSRVAAVVAVLVSASVATK